MIIMIEAISYLNRRIGSYIQVGIAAVVLHCKQLTQFNILLK